MIELRPVERRDRVVGERVDDVVGQLTVGAGHQHAVCGIQSLMAVAVRLSVLGNRVHVLLTTATDNRELL